MGDLKKYKKDQDLVFQNIEEKGKLEKQTDQALLRFAAGMREDFERHLMRYKYFRKMSAEEREVFIKDYLRRRP